ncbi:hypothetical protein [Chitinophaga eiseniae]|nr:hypothetical protein [Chitinophaga eiseniae]
MMQHFTVSRIASGTNNGTLEYGRAAKFVLLRCSANRQQPKMTLRATCPR